MSFISNLLNKKEKTIVPVTITSVSKLEAPEITSTIESGEWFTSKEHYLEFTAAFKKWASEKKDLNAAHFLLYAILRNRKWIKGWTYPKNPGKQVEHNFKKSNAFQTIKSSWNEEYLLAPFDGTITTEMLIAVHENLADIRKEE